MTTQKMFSIFSILFILILLASCSSLPKCQNLVGLEEKQCQEDVRVMTENHLRFQRFNDRE